MPGTLQSGDGGTNLAGLEPFIIGGTVSFGKTQILVVLLSVLPPEALFYNSFCLSIWLNLSAKS
jgi:hypothetical protein